MSWEMILLRVGIPVALSLINKVLNKKPRTIQQKAYTQLLEAKRAVEKVRDEIG